MRQVDELRREDEVGGVGWRKKEYREVLESWGMYERSGCALELGMMGSGCSLNSSTNDVSGRVKS